MQQLICAWLVCARLWCEHWVIWEILTCVGTPVHMFWALNMLLVVFLFYPFISLTNIRCNGKLLLDNILIVCLVIRLCPEVILMPKNNSSNKSLPRLAQGLWCEINLKDSRIFNFKSTWKTNPKVSFCIQNAVCVPYVLKLQMQLFVNITRVYEENSCWIISPWNHNDGALQDQASHGLFLCVINGNCEDFK